MISKAFPKKSRLTPRLAAIITGASSGIGQAIALKLAYDYSARMVINARDQMALDQTAQMVAQVGGQAIAIAGDIGNEAVIKSLAETCLSKYGAVDVLINNAGLAKSGPMDKLTVEDWQQVFGVNFFASLKLIYELLPYFLEKKAGKIVNVSSIAGKIAFPGSVCYAASKFALTGLSAGMAAELAAYDIEVITVCPGWVRTDFFKKNKAAEDPTEIAREQSLKGWLMRNVLSISSEEAAFAIVAALKKGGSHEIILTCPGIILERLAGICPTLVYYLCRLVPAARGQGR